MSRLVFNGIWLAAFVACAGAPRRGASAEAWTTADESDSYVARVVASPLDRPAGVVVRHFASGDGVPWEALVADSGAGEIVRLRPGAADGRLDTSTAVRGFPQAPWMQDGKTAVGPLGVALLTPTKLAVGGAGQGHGQEQIRVYALSDDPDELAPINYDDDDHSVGPLRPLPQLPRGGGEFAGLAVVDEALLATSPNDAAHGWILKAPLSANRLTGLHPLVDAGRISGSVGPAALAVAPRETARYLLVGFRGELTSELDSRLGYFSPHSGKLAMALDLGLRDVSGLAFSAEGNLYATDASWRDPAAGGVFRIEATPIDGLESCRGVRIATIPFAHGLAFAPDGGLLVTAAGAPESRDESDATPGGPSQAGAVWRVDPRDPAEPL